MNYLSCGCSGADVLELQQLLRTAGYNIGCDGVFGGETYAAVVNYQQKNGLDPDGVVGEMTWNALKNTTTRDEIVSALEDCLAAIERLPEFQRLSGLMEVD